MARPGPRGAAHAQTAATPRPGGGKSPSPSDSPSPALRQPDFETFFHSFVDPLVLISRDGTVVAVNEPGRRLFAHARNGADIAGLPLRDLFPAAHRVGIDAGLAQAWAGDLATVTVQYGSDAAALHPLDLVFMPTPAGNEPPDLVVALLREPVRDVDRPERAPELERLEAAARLASGLVHDFNNILTVILGNSELLAEMTAGNDAAHRLAQASLLAARTGAELARMLLAGSRPQGAPPSEFCASDMLHEMRSLLACAAGDRIAIDVATDPVPWAIRADRARLATVLLNLALNARDAMPNGGRIVFEARNVVLDPAHMRAHADAIACEHVQIVVRDNGSGIPAEIRNRVFEPFFTTKAPGNGSGLGLSLVQGFVRQSGGHVTVDSADGAGTAISLFFPRVPSQSQVPQ